jgi:hypothetical protein
VGGRVDKIVSLSADLKTKVEEALYVYREKNRRVFEDDTLTYALQADGSYSLQNASVNNNPVGADANGAEKFHENLKLSIAPFGCLPVIHEIDGNADSQVEYWEVERLTSGQSVTMSTVALQTIETSGLRNKQRTSKRISVIKSVIDPDGKTYDVRVDYDPRNCPNND